MAREAYPDATYINVKSNAEKLQAMLDKSGGVRRVPVIVDGDSVTIGYQGGT